MFENVNNIMDKWKPVEVVYLDISKGFLIKPSQEAIKENLVGYFRVRGRKFFHGLKTSYVMGIKEQ